jgi:hypothetical protein
MARFWQGSGGSMSADTWLASIAIGIAASIAGMIWAFRRGVLGVLANLGAGIAGAVAGAALGHVVAERPGAIISGPAIPGIPAPAGPPQLFFAGLGSLLALVALHLAWNAMVAVRRTRQASAR